MSIRKLNPKNKADAKLIKEHNTALSQGLGLEEKIKYKIWEMIMDCPCMSSRPVRVKFDFGNAVDGDHFNWFLEANGLKEKNGKSKNQDR